MNKMYTIAKESARQIKPQQWLLIVVLIEWLAMLQSGVGFPGLYDDHFFDLGVDGFQWFFFVLNIPQLFLKHFWLSSLADVVIAMSIIWLFLRPQHNKLAIVLFNLLLLHYVTLTACLGHRNFQTGMMLVVLPFMFKEGKGRLMAFQALLYYVGFFYFSSACFKIMGSGVQHMYHMSEVLQRQQLIYTFEKNNDWRLTIINWLINHPSASYFAFIITIIVEGAVGLLFFFRRFSSVIALCLIAFHIFNWIIMDIGVIGQFSLLFFLLKYNKLTYDKMPTL